MSAGNGDRHGDTPLEAQPLGDLAARDQIALLRECVHGIGALREDALVTLEYAQANAGGIKALDAKIDSQQETLDALTVSVARMRAEQARQSAKLGLVDAEVKLAKAHTVDFAALAYDREDTEVKRIRDDLAHVERLRLEAATRRADMWSWVRRIMRVAVPAVALVVVAALAAAKGWLE